MWTVGGVDKMAASLKWKSNSCVNKHHVIVDTIKLNLMNGMEIENEMPSNVTNARGCLLFGHDNLNLKMA